MPLGAAALLLVVPIPFDRLALTRGAFKAPDELLDFGIELLPVDGRVGEELLFYRDGINATVSVHQADGVTAMRVNGKVDASNAGDMSTQVLRDLDALVETSWGRSNLQFRRDAAEILRVAGKAPRAVELFESLLEGRDPGWSQGWLLLARAYSQVGDSEGTARAYANARATRATRANQARRFHRMARAAEWRGRRGDAQNLLRAAVAADPEYADARRDLDGRRN